MYRCPQEPTGWLGKAPIPSYHSGTFGDGFTFPQPFGAYPATISDEEITSERYSIYTTYYKKPRFEITGSASQQAAVSQSIILTAKDADGALRPEYTGVKSLVFNGAGSSTNPVNLPTANGIPFGLPTPVTFVNGVATVSLVLFKQETATISTSDPLATISTSQALSVTVQEGAMDHFEVTGNASQNAGASQVVTISARDLIGNSVTAYSGAKMLTFLGAAASASPVTAPTAVGSPFGAPVAVTFVNGVATVPITLFRAETASISVSDGTFSTPSPLAVVVSPLALSKFAIAGSATQSAGSTQTVTVTAQDPYGNTATSLSQTVTALFTGANPAATAQPKANGFSFGGATPISFVGGIASVGLELVKAEPALIALSAGSFQTSDPLSVTVGPGPAASLNLSGPAALVQRLTQSLTLTARDAFGNVATGYLGTVAVGSTDIQATLPGPVFFTTNDSGVRSFSLTLRGLGLQAVTADGVAGALTASLNISVTSSGSTSPPAAVADAYTLNEDGHPTVAAGAGVLANDSDPQNLPLSAELVAAPLNGTLQLNNDGSFNYTPTANSNGSDSFTYRARNGALLSA